MADSASVATSSNINKMKVAELKAVLTERGLSTSGNKKELLERLQQALDEEEDTTAEQQNGSGESEEHGEAEAAPLASAEVSLISEADDSANNLSLNEPVSPTEKVAVISKSMTPAERLAMRAERFGTKNVESKKVARAQRFGIPVADGGASTTPLKGEDAEKIKKRADRFGQIVSPTLAKSSDSEKILKRKERFGATVASAGLTGTEIEDKKRKRAERFGAQV